MRWRRCWHDCVLFGKQTRSGVRSPIFHQTKTLSIIVFLSLSTDILTSYSPYAQTAMHVLEGANRGNPGPITIAKLLSLRQSSFQYYSNDLLCKTHREEIWMSWKIESLFVMYIWIILFQITFQLPLKWKIRKMNTYTIFETISFRLGILLLLEKNLRSIFRIFWITEANWGVWLIVTCQNN